MRCMKTTIFCNVIFALFFMIVFASIVAATDEFDYLRDLSPEELNFDQLNKDEQNYIQKLMFAPCGDIIPMELQKRMMDSVYFSLGEIIEVVQYSKLWQIEIEDGDAFTKYPIKIYKLVRTDLSPQRIITHVLYDELKKTYKIVGFEEMISDCFNEVIDVEINSPIEAIGYLQDFIQMTKYHTKVVNNQWLNPTYGFRDTKERGLCPPMVLYSSNEYFIIKLFVERQIDPKYTYISKIIGIVSYRGQVVFTEKIMK